MTIRLIAVRRERVEKCVRLLSAASFYPRIIDVDSYALERVVRRQLKEFLGLTAIINIDRSAILIVVIDSEKMVYAHEDVVDPKELESIAQIIVQLKLKLQLVFSTLHQPLEQIILVGEKAVFTELGPAINNQFNIQTTTINPFFGMKLSTVVSKKVIQEIAPIMAISCGLALRVTDDNWN